VADRVLRLNRRQWARRTGVGLVVAVAVGGGYAAHAATVGTPDADRYRTALVATGSIDQHLPLTGTVQRVTRVTATFPVSGKVTGVSVAVGDSVTAGQPLATLDTGPLRQAVLDAQARLLQAQAQLASDASPATSSTGSGVSSGSSGSAPRTQATGSGAAGSSAAGSSATTRSSGTGGSSGAARSSGSSGSGSDSGVTSGSDSTSGPSAQLTRLKPLVNAVDAAVKAQEQACLPVLGRLGATPTPSPTTSPTQTGTTPPTTTSTTTTAPTTTSTTTTAPTTTSTTTTAPTTTSTTTTAPTTTSTTTTAPTTTSTTTTGPTTTSTTTTPATAMLTPTETATTASRVLASPVGWFIDTDAAATRPRPNASPTTTGSTPTGSAPTADQVAACVAAMTAVATAQATVSKAVGAMAETSARGGPPSTVPPPADTSTGTSTGTSAAKTSTGKGGTGAGSGSKPAASSSSGPASSSGSGSASGSGSPARSASGEGSTGSSTGSGAAAAGGPSPESRGITDQGAVSAAQLALDTANADLAAATLTAPIAGTVGSIAFSAGGSAGTSAGIVIVGPGAATVTVPVPLANLPSVRNGQQVRVTAAGATAPVDGTVSAIGLLPLSSTTGATPTYPVTVLVPQAGNALSSGSRADVSIVTAHAADVLVVPGSAVTTVSTGTGVVRVLKDGVATNTPVQTGAVGGGLVEVTEGVTAGQEVVLADRSEALPTASTPNRGLTGGGLGGAGLGGGKLNRGAGTGGAPARG